MNNSTKLPSEQKQTVNFLLKGPKGVVITLNADGTASASNNPDLMFTWTYIGLRLELRSVIDQMTIDLAMSFDDLEEINTND